MVKISEELGRAYSSAGLCFGMHCVGSAVIAAKATTWQKKNYLEPIANGEHITTLALSEPGTGSHFYFPQTALSISGDEITINGAKTFVTNGSHADSYVISTLASGTHNADQFSCILLDEGTQGMEWGKEWDGMGMRGNSSRPVNLENIKLNRQHILGEEGDQLWYVFNVVAPYFLMAMAGTYLGVADAAFREAKNSIAKRTYSHSGANLSHLSIIQHKLGGMWQKLESTRALIYNAALLGDKNDPSSLPYILSAKVAAATCAVDLANEAMTIAGGIGYSNNSALAMLLRDARAAHVMAPTTDILQTWIGRALLDQPLLSD
ncbi:acyl-CoA dehydrogenase family protein [Flavobacterium sp. N1736]|uniref:acyl-CoA dehydrogenase family protein n=1 Tax=Flavobacterium sp. N1736 TaxID=2986823 RepID=UPI002224CB2F|nr:acyl-CoA dehydrogenase [Flavobacterium sp. N1736]